MPSKKGYKVKGTKKSSIVHNAKTGSKVRVSQTSPSGRSRARSQSRSAGVKAGRTRRTPRGYLHDK